MNVVCSYEEKTIKLNITITDFMEGGTEIDGAVFLISNSKASLMIDRKVVALCVNLTSCSLDLLVY